MPSHMGVITAFNYIVLLGKNNRELMNNDNAFSITLMKLQNTFNCSKLNETVSQLGVQSKVIIQK